MSKPLNEQLRDCRKIVDAALVRIDDLGEQRASLTSKLDAALVRIHEFDVCIHAVAKALGSPACGGVDTLATDPFGTSGVLVAAIEALRNQEITLAKEPCAHMYPSDLAKFETSETFAHAYSVAVGNPSEVSVPLYREPRVYVAKAVRLKAIRDCRDRFIQGSVSWKELDEMYAGEKNMSRIIGLHGLPGAGKDAIADHLVKTHGFVKIAFASLLKDELTSVFEISPEYFNNRALKEIDTPFLTLMRCVQHAFTLHYLHTDECRAEMNAGMNVLDAPRSPRWIMQRYGDWRVSHNKNYFVDGVAEFCVKNETLDIVITDVRYEVEAAMLVYGFGESEIWLVTRPGVEAYDHKSNKRLSFEYIDRIVCNDGTLEQLGATVTNMLTR